MPENSPFHLAVALDGTGWHPAAWREPDARPAEVFTAAYWTDLATQAERGLLDFITIEDGLAMQSSAGDGRPDGRTDQLRGRLDALLIAARVAPVTNRIGLVPSVTVTHTEPFHVSKAVATLDYVSQGRAGVRVQVSGRPHETAHFGRRVFPEQLYRERDRPEFRAVLDDLFEEAGDYVEVLRRLWDSWEDDAEIRDATTGRFIDRSRLHYIDFEGRWFNVKGPSITPRPPQGQPVVTALAHATVPFRFASHHADVVYITPQDADQSALITGEVLDEYARSGRASGDLRVLADVLVFLDRTEKAATERRARLDEVAGRQYRSDARIFAGTPVELAALMDSWRSSGLDGFRLRPATIPHDLDAVTAELIPELQGRGLFRHAYDARTLRGHLGLARPANRYAAV
jgi:alkanesulfonate monooxygenase SsuD/methylene tetrahydromethanopterin reductase-like flavin-dependent oxidoreductase (luciferase family)